MLPRDLRCTRRKFLASTAALTLGGGIAGNRSLAGGSAGERSPIAVLGSVYRPLSYLYHLAGRFLHGVPSVEQPQFPKHRIASLWLDQLPENDLSKEVARRFGIQRARTVRDALTKDDRLAVDGILIVLEHGNYPRNDWGQILYPRAEVFDQVVDVIRSIGSTVPVFVAKHLSHSFTRATEMVRTADVLGIPLMAGSTLATASREPEIIQNSNPPIREILVAGYGPIEVFGFDALEALQSLIERRSGGESGVASVRCLSGPEVWRAGDRGEWSWDLLHAALARSDSANLGDPRDNVGTIALPGMPATPPIAFLIEYRDGARGTVLLLNGHVQDFVSAVRLESEPGVAACRFVTTPAPGMHHFNRHVEAIDEFLSTRQTTQPIQRTLLTTGALEKLMESHALGGRRIDTPELEMNY